jgi:hypothetical protein
LNPSLFDHPFVRVFRRMKPKDRKKFIQWLSCDAYTLRHGLAPRAGYIEAFLSKKGDTKASTKGGPTSLQLTYLRRELDRFLAIGQFLDRPVQVKLHTARAYQSYKMEAQASRLLATEQPLHERVSPRESLDEFLREYELVYGGYTLPKSGEDHIGHVLPMALDRLYITEKLRSACHIAALSNLREQTSNTTLVSEVLRLTDHHPWREDFLVQLYATAYRILTVPTEDDRRRLRNLLNERPQAIKHPSLRDVFMILLNDGIRQMNTGHQEYQRYCFDLFRLGLQENILFAGRNLTAQTFSNISLTALKLKEFEWLKEFLADYGHRLRPNDQRTILPYCQANYHYECGNLEKASDLLVGFDYSRSSVTMQLQARITLAKVYFDQGARELLESHLHSITVFLSRHKELGYHRQICLDFVRLCKKILHLPERPEAKKINVLKKEISQIPVTSFQEWLEARVPK